MWLAWFALKSDDAKAYVDDDLQEPDSWVEQVLAWQK